MLRALLMTLVLAVLPSELPAQERYTVSYGGFAGYHAPLWAAKDLGLFAKHGLNADPVMISGSPRGMQALLSGSSYFAFEKLSPEKACAAVAEEGSNIMAIWDTPVDCIEKIKFYADALKPEQLMLNIASRILPQRDALACMRLFAQEAMPALRSL